MRGLLNFTRKKKPLSSTGRNYAELNNSVNMRSPLYSNANVDRALTSLVSAYKKRNLKAYGPTLAALQKYVKEHPEDAESYINSRLSSFSNRLSNGDRANVRSDILSVLRNLETMGFAGGRRCFCRKSTRRTRRR